MKTKKFQKKLTLNKKTIVDLNNGEMKGAQGGADEPSIPPFFCPITFYNCFTVDVGNTCCPLGGHSC